MAGSTTCAAVAFLALMCASTAAARPVPLAPANADAAAAAPMSRQLIEQHMQQQQLQQQQLAAAAGMPVPRLLRYVPTDVSSMLAANDAKGAIMMAVDSGSPDATMWAANRNAADTWMVANGGSYAYAGLAGPRGAGGLYNPFAY